MNITQFHKIFCLFFLSSCNSTGNGGTKLDLERPDIVTSVAQHRIIAAERMLDSLNYGLTSDSIKFYMYSVFYDEKLKSLSGSQYYCFYNFVPIYVDTTDRTLLIRYNLLKRNKKEIVEFTLSFIDVEYAISKFPKFSRKGISVLGKVYLPDRLNHVNVEEIWTFLEQNNEKVNDWYLKEISKRM